MESFFSPFSSLESCFLSSLDLDVFILVPSSDPVAVVIAAPDAGVVDAVELVEAADLSPALAFGVMAAGFVSDTAGAAAAVFEDVGAGVTNLRIHAERLNEVFSYFLMKACSSSSEAWGLLSGTLLRLFLKGKELELQCLVKFEEIKEHIQKKKKKKRKKSG